MECSAPFIIASTCNGSSGHDHAHSGFMAGFIHPFTGLDHLVMALGFGVLLWSAAKQWKIAGVIALSITLIIGFLVGAQGLVPVNMAEYGIVASLVITAIALWTKSIKFYQLPRHYLQVSMAWLMVLS